MDDDGRALQELDHDECWSLLSTQQSAGWA